MAIDILSDPVAKKIKYGLGAAILRQSLIADNVANMDTPSYRRKDIAFPQVLRQQMAENQFSMTGTSETHGRHIPLNDSAQERNQFNIRFPNTTPSNAAGNNVDIDLEMGNMATNSVFYESLMALMSKKMGTYRTVITGRPSP